MTHHIHWKAVARWAFVTASCASLSCFCPRIDSRPPQFEAKYVLKSLLRDKQTTFSRQQNYDTAFESLFMQPEFSNRYLYVFSASGPAQDRTQPPDGGVHTILLADPRARSKPDNDSILAGIPPSVLASAGVDGSCPACDFTIVSAGNADEDATIDVWSISTKRRTIGDEDIPAGVPFNHISDQDH